MAILLPQLHLLCLVFVLPFLFTLCIGNEQSRRYEISFCLCCKIPSLTALLEGRVSQKIVAKKCMRLNCAAEKRISLSVYRCLCKDVFQVVQCTSVVDSSQM